MNMVCCAVIALAGTALSASGQDVPFATKVVSMKYPRLAAYARITGNAVLRVRIDSNGKVISATGLSGHPILVKDATANILLWRFAAGKSAGEKADSEFDFTYVFKLKGVSHSDRTSSSLTYEYPNKVTVVSDAFYVET
jgi:TonB family protein